MPDDQVTIDPEFVPSPPPTGWSGWLRLGALAAAAFILGWLLLSPGSGEVDTTEAAPSTTAASQESSTTTRPSPTTSTTMFATVGSEASLGEAVLGFTDTITIAVAGGEQGEEVEVVRWLPSQTAPETILSFPEDYPQGWGWFAGLDAAGTWYAVNDEHEVLSVRPVTAGPDAEGWLEQPIEEVVGLRVVGAAWHDTAPGRLAWLTCSQVPDGPDTLYTLDIAARVAEPLAVARWPDACSSSPLWLNQWGDWGFALDRMGFTAETVLLDSNGTELARVEHNPDGSNLVAAGPGDTVWNEEYLGGVASFLLSLDGQQRTPIPGLAEGEWVEQAQWSPDGSRIALVVSGPQADQLQIVDAVTGETTDEIEELGPVVFQTRWSGDGRYLLVGHDRDDGGAAGAALVVYDTVTAEIAMEQPFREAHFLTEIRTFEPSSIPMQFTPVEWGIALEEGWGPGVYTVRMSADARTLLPEQIEAVGGRLVWDETVVELCNIGIDGVGGGSVHIGDIFQTIEGCGANPNAMQEAFDEFGLPETACLVVTSGGVDHEYCAPLGVDESP